MVMDGPPNWEWQNHFKGPKINLVFVNITSKTPLAAKVEAHETNTHSDQIEPLHKCIMQRASK